MRLCVCSHNDLSLPVREVWIEMPPLSRAYSVALSLPVGAVWIEIRYPLWNSEMNAVTSREGSVD